MNKTTGKRIELVSLAQYKDLDLKEEEILELQQKGIKDTDYTEVDGIADDICVPHAEFAKCVFNKKIQGYLSTQLPEVSDAIKDGKKVIFEQSNWVEVVDKDDNLAFDVAITVLAEDDEEPDFELLAVECFRVKVWEA